ncbi:MAG: putative zinc-binding protein [Chloroflexi bacterium]|nr:putative zinc-binding protein [Chloroflexota bacterium]
MVERTVRTVIFACSGASNCGQIANAVVIKLAETGIGYMSCIAGIGAHDKKIIEGAKSADRIIAVDGCGIACTRKILEHTGVTVTQWINVTDYGIKKAHNRLSVEPSELEHVLVKVNETLS